MRGNFEIAFLVEGAATGPLLILEEPLSFWGGVDLTTGKLTDVTHPQNGCSLSGHLMIAERTKGSTAGPGALLELIRNGNGPAAILMYEPDPAPIAAAMAAELIGLAPLPVALISRRDRAALRQEYAADPAQEFVIDSSEGSRIGRAVK